MLTAIYFLTALDLVFSLVSLNIAGTAGVESGRQGMAAGLLTMAQQIGAAIGVSAAIVVITRTIRLMGGGPTASLEGHRSALFFSLGLIAASIILAPYLVYRFNQQQKRARLREPNK